MGKASLPVNSVSAGPTLLQAEVSTGLVPCISCPRPYTTKVWVKTREASFIAYQGRLEPRTLTFIHEGIQLQLKSRWSLEVYARNHLYFQNNDFHSSGPRSVALDWAENRFLLFFVWMLCHFPPLFGTLRAVCDSLEHKQSSGWQLCNKPSPLPHASSEWIRVRLQSLCERAPDLLSASPPWDQLVPLRSGSLLFLSWQTLQV